MCIQNEKIKQFFFVVLLSSRDGGKKPVFVIKESAGWVDPNQFFWCLVRVCVYVCSHVDIARLKKGQGGGRRDSVKK